MNDRTPGAATHERPTPAPTPEHRHERTTDGPAIRAVHLAAFGGPTEADLVDALRGSGDVALSLVALMNGEIVGHALFTNLAAPFPAVALAPLAVRPDHQRRGIGSLLIRQGLTQLWMGGTRAVFVLGDPAYYGRFGFSAEKAAGFETPYAGEHFMVLQIGGALPETSGTLNYAPAFARLG